MHYDFKSHTLNRNFLLFLFKKVSWLVYLSQSMNSLYLITGSPFRVFPLGNNEKTFDKGVFMKISVNTSSSYYTIFRLIKRHFKRIFLD